MTSLVYVRMCVCTIHMRVTRQRVQVPWCDFWKRCVAHVKREGSTQDTPDSLQQLQVGNKEGNGLMSATH